MSHLNIQAVWFKQRGKGKDKDHAQHLTTSMEKEVYSFGVTVLVILSICLFFQNALNVYYGLELGYRRSFLPWLTSIAVLSLISQSILLVFYESKKYWVVFSLASLTILASLFSFCVRYLTAGYYEPIPLRHIANVCLLGASFLLALSLIFSKAKENKYLRTVGIMSAPLHLFMGILSWFWGTNYLGIGVWYFIMDLLPVLGFMYCLIPMLFALCLRSEVSALYPSMPRGTLFKRLYFSVGVSISIVMVLLGANLVQSSDKRVLAAQTNFKAKQIAKKFEEHLYVNNEGQSIQYQLLRPIKYDSTKKYPLVVALHSGAGWGTDNIRQFEGSWCADFLSKRENQLKYPAFIFVPQCAPWLQFGAIPSPHKSVDHLIFEIMDILFNEFSIDRSRIYVSGMSLGGYGSWHLISERPDLFAAAIPIAGGGNPRSAARLKDIAIWAFHGARDKNVPVRYTRDMIEAIKTHGGNPRYTEFETAGHGLWHKIHGTSELLPWLFEQEKP